MKILTIVGTRPELIRLNLIIKKLDNLITVNHILVYTNQNYDYNLSTLFFNELEIRTPDYYFGFDYKSFGQFLSKSIIEFENILLKETPDKILILGDTNSGLLSIVGEKYGIPIYHMEAGNRCYDNRLPEETNRKIIDNISTYNLPYTEDSKNILLNEGFHRNNIFKTGNPIYEVINYYNHIIENNDVLNRLNLIDNEIIKEYVLITTHRTENVDQFFTLNEIVRSINEICKKYVVIFSIHPRTKDRLNYFGIKVDSGVIISEPFGFFDFIKLEKNAKCIISDSGTVQEEACIFGVPSITIRETTERRETIECGSNILSGAKYDNIMEAFNEIEHRYVKWNVPNDYLVTNVSDIIVNILLNTKTKKND
jgi:UDP-N-acetylglucosamine 2-epimerase (non-hydrolysing)